MNELREDCWIPATDLQPGDLVEGSHGWAPLSRVDVRGGGSAIIEYRTIQRVEAGALLHVLRYVEGT